MLGYAKMKYPAMHAISSIFLNNQSNGILNIIKVLFDSWEEEDLSQANIIVSAA